MISIYHNPRCSKSREALSLLEDKNVDHTVIKYLDDPLSESALKNILKILKIKPIELVRINESIWKENFTHLNLSDDAIIKVMVTNPILIERPIIINGDKAVIGRPPTKILDIL